MNIPSRQRLPRPSRVRAWLWSLLLLAVLWPPRPLFSHPLGAESVDHYSQVKITLDKAIVVYDVDLAEVATFQEMKRLDTNGDGVADDAEKRVYAQAQARAQASNLHLEINGAPLPLAPASAKMFLVSGQGTLPTMRIIATFETLPGALAAAERGTGPQAGSYRDDNEPHRIGWRQIGVEGLGRDVVDQSIGGHRADNSPQGFAMDQDGNASDVHAVDFHFVPRAAAAVRSGPTARPAVEPRRRDSDAFASLMTAEHLTVAKMWWLLVLAAGLGGMHALAPGHGKTLVAAYLVGSRGTTWHALILGLIVTFTHTIGVFTLGLVTLFASRYLLPETLYPWLTAISGLVIAQVGLLRLFGHGGFQQHSHGDEHDHEHVHGLAHAHAHEHGVAHSHADVHQHEHAHAHLHEGHSQTHAHDLGHSHAHPHENDEHEHRHDEVGHSDARPPHGEHHQQDHEQHDHDHDHGHHHHHLPPVGEAITWRSLLALGVSGGLVPCPSALVVLLSAVALHQIGFGLALIVAFSAGLALVLTVIGIVMVSARNFVSSRFTIPAWLLGLVPKVGAVFITCIGLAIALPAVILLVRRY